MTDALNVILKISQQISVENDISLTPLLLMASLKASVNMYIFEESNLNKF